jgi:alcohol dehydrogenase class IV
MTFEFATAGRILFGQGALDKVTELAEALGSPAFVVTGRNVERAEPVFARLQRAGCSWSVFPIEHEPTIGDILQAKQNASQRQIRWVIGCGGGSALDTGKALAALLTNPGHPLDYLEVVGEGRPLTQDPSPYVAIPTTAGTGAEVTRNAVLKSAEHKVKVSLRNPKMLPKVALLDPSLTWSMPAHITAQTGLDALSQVIEPYLSMKANPLTDSFCREAIRRAGQSLQAAFKDGQDREARRDMALVSLMGGLALANAGLGAVHGFAGPFGGMFDAPHGAVCAALLPHVMRINLKALQDRGVDDGRMTRFDEVAQLLTGNLNADAHEGIRFLDRLCEDLKIEGLSTYGMTDDDIPELTLKASRSSSMRGNPLELTQAEMEHILVAAM